MAGSWQSTCIVILVIWQDLECPINSGALGKCQMEELRQSINIDNIDSVSAPQFGRPGLYCDDHSPKK